MKTSTITRARSVLPILLVLFIGSGCAALIYEIVWLQLLQLVIGLTNVSLGVLLAVYMGGMSLGSVLLPRLVPARHHPLRVYALLEIGIGVIGMALLFILPRVAHVYADIVGRGLPGILLRALVAAICLLPPTILMGATLPAMARWIEGTREGIAWLGFFYGGNLAGAVIGCLLAGFYLLRVHDMPFATYVAAAINLTIALIGLGLASVVPRLADPTPASDESNGLSPSAGGSTSPPSNRHSDPPVRPGRPWLIYVGIALSGMSALGAEVVWTRLLSLILGGTVYTFSIILAVFLIGLGLGSTVGAFWSRTNKNPKAAFGLCQLFLVGAIAWTAWMIGASLPYWPINPALSLGPWFTFQLDLARCLWSVLPPAFLWGASFPLALAAVAIPGKDPGRTVGGLYSANTLGAIAGALIFSLLVIPSLGTRWAERLLIGLAAGSALWLCAPEVWAAAANQSSRSIGRRCAVALAAVAALASLLGLSALFAWKVPTIPWGSVAYGRFMATYGNRLAPGLVAEKDVPIGSSQNPDIYCTYLGEGMNGSIAVTKWTTGVRNFHSAGKVQASTEVRDMRLQRMLGHMSALVHHQPESVLVVACGAGVTAGTFVLHPHVQRIVICDIEPLVPQSVAPLFKEENYDVVHDPRTQLVFDDGRHFIRTTHEKFDIITSDPIDPWVKGCAALNTVEYYEMCKAHLKPGGVLSLWIPLYESNSEAVKSLIATFFKVFPQGTLWSNDSEGEGYDAVLLGQVEPTQINLDEIADRLDRPDHGRVKRSLIDAGFRSGVGLFSTYAGRASDLKAWTQNAQINTDWNLRSQYLAGMGYNSYLGAEILTEITSSMRFPENLFVGSETRLRMLKSRLENAVRNH